MCLCLHRRAGQVASAAAAWLGFELGKRASVGKRAGEDRLSSSERDGIRRGIDGDETARLLTEQIQTGYTALYAT
jgi:hypothetical protein